MDFTKSSDSDDEEIIFTNNMLKRRKITIFSVEISILVSTNRDKHKLDLDDDAKKEIHFYLVFSRRMILERKILRGITTEKR